MYLSRVYVAWPKSRNAYTLHKALWELFPNRPDDDRDFLFRVEREKAGQGAILLMQSREEPADADEAIEVQATRPYMLSLSKGQRIRFLLKANPVKTIKDVKGRKNSKGEVKSCRVPLIREEEQLRWLARKLDGIVNLEEVQVSPCLPMYFKKSTHAGKIVPVRYEGIGILIDPKAFSTILESGLGPAKSLGCGMLSVAPA